MNKDELTQLLMKSLYKNKNNTLDAMESKPNSKKIVDSIMKGQEHNDEIIDKVINNLQSDSNPFHDLAKLFAKKYASSDLEKLCTPEKVLDLESASDACVSQYYAHQNFGMCDALFAGRYYKQKAIYRTYLRFDICSIPCGMNITNVTMKLNMYTTGLNKDTILEIYPVLQNWREYAICWKNQPRTAPEPYAGITVSPHSNQNVEMDITELFKCWYSNPDKNYGMLLKGDEHFNALMAFTSREYPNSGMRPRLVISYN